MKKAKYKCYDIVYKTDSDTDNSLLPEELRLTELAGPTEVVVEIELTPQLTTSLLNAVKKTTGLDVKRFKFTILPDSLIE